MNIVLIGCGRVAHIHMNVYKNLKKANVVAVSDVDINRAKAFAQLYNIEKAFSNCADIFEVRDLGFVDVCTPTSTHETIVRDAAKYGINVLMEKPMGRNSKECEKMIEEAKKHGIKMCVCHNQLFYPHVQRLKSIADSQDFSLVCFRTSHRENFEWLVAHGLAQPWNVSSEHGGILWEVGTHLAYLQLHFLKDIEEVYAIGTKAKYSVWDDFIVLLRASSHCWGVMEISLVAKESEIVYEIVSSDGRRVQTFLPHGYMIERMEESPASITGVARNFSTDLKRLYRKWLKFALDQVKKPQLGHSDLIRRYIESLEKKFSPPVTGEDGRNAIRLLECIEISLKERSPVKYSPW